MSKLKTNKIFLIVLLGLFLRVFSIITFGDSQIDKEWGTMLYNLENHHMLSARSVNGTPVPNLFMPPLYALFLFVIKTIFIHEDSFLNVIFFIQLLLSLLSIYLMFLIFLKIFNQKISLIGTFLYAIFPLNIYAVSQISSITLQMFLINLFLLYFIKIFNQTKHTDLIFFSIFSALLILLRGEFFLFVFFSIIFLMIKSKSFTKYFLSSLLIIILISPYLYRNYTIFNVLTITKSTGYNLLKGNNPKSKVEGIRMFGAIHKVVPELKDKLVNLEKKGPIAEHDLKKDQILLDQAVKFIKEDPKKYFNLYIQKFISFLFVDINSSYPNYYSFFHLLPKIILSIGTLIGIIMTASFRVNLQNYFILFYLLNISLFSVFFILPRYSLILLPLQLIISLEGYKVLKRKLFN